MCGSETLAMEESSTSINVAMVTVSATAQGLCEGFQSRCVPAGVMLTPDAYVRLHGHSRTQAIQTVLIGFETHANRDALHHLDVVPGGVFRRQDAGNGARAAADVLDVAFEIQPKPIHVNAAR